MTSYYFTCSGGIPGRPQELDGYEADLALTPVSISASDAPAANQQVLAGGVGVMRWPARETAVLRWLSERSP